MVVNGKKVHEVGFVNFFGYIWLTVQYSNKGSKRCFIRTNLLLKLRALKRFVTASLQCSKIILLFFSPIVLKKDAEPRCQEFKHRVPNLLGNSLKK